MILSNNKFIIYTFWIRVLFIFYYALLIVNQIILMIYVSMLFIPASFVRIIWILEFSLILCIAGMLGCRFLLSTRKDGWIACLLSITTALCLFSTLSHSFFYSSDKMQVQMLTSTSSIGSYLSHFQYWTVGHISQGLRIMLLYSSFITPSWDHTVILEVNQDLGS